MNPNRSGKTFIGAAFKLILKTRAYPGPERKYSIHRCYSGILHQFPYLLQISTCENALASQTGRRGRDTAERLHCLMQDRNSKWKINAPQPPQAEVKVNIWEIKPPDFSYKLYTSLRLAGKPSRTIMQEERRKIPDFPGKMVPLPSLRNPPKKAISPKFITTFPRLDSQKAKLMFVESGKYPNGVYLNPKPHDFRQVQSNLPNFVTTYEKDPFGLKFKSQHLSTVSGCPLLKNGQQNSTERFITYKPCECAWDSKLILPKAPWPVKSASYTRHRRRRDAYSAFMDRVEEKFNKTCKTMGENFKISC
ncbi:uncharacterized protein LOC112586450 [Bubalus bubalis]|uniref:uncharacterized protein LOC112586450 n=1 Tax=Bubalus bubalis TaxID=89462 RepID=UPI001E1B7B17|nr:uncharacterized protein LOC112586450 [Bubalus bubalis]